MKRDKFAPLFQIYEIDAWAEDEGGWYWNAKYTIGNEFRTSAEDLRKVFLQKLRDIRKRPLHHGSFKVVWDDFNILEVQRRSDGCPVYAMVRLSHER